MGMIQWEMRREEMRGDGMRWDGVGWDGMREGVSTSSCESTCRMGWDEMRRDEGEGRGEGGGAHGERVRLESTRVQRTRQRHANANANANATRRVKSSQRGTSESPRVSAHVTVVRHGESV